MTDNLPSLDITAEEIAEFREIKRKEREEKEAKCIKDKHDYMQDMMTMNYDICGHPPNSIVKPLFKWIEHEIIRLKSRASTRFADLGRRIVNLELRLEDLEKKLEKKDA